jgi:hypothetical protein
VEDPSSVRSASMYGARKEHGNAHIRKPNLKSFSVIIVGAAIDSHDGSSSADA